MNPLHRRKNLRRRRRPLVILLLVLMVVVLGAAYTLVPNTVTGVVHGVAKPVWNTTAALSETIDVLPASFSESHELARENKRLRRKLSKARLRLKRLSVIRSENRIYRRMWARADLTTGRLAAVLATPPQTSHDVIVLDIGRTDDVEVGDRVVRAGVAMGAIQTVYAETSIAQLFSTSDVRTDAYVVERDMGITLRGANNGTFRGTVPKDVTLEKGDTIVLPGDRQLVVAEVVAISSQPSDPQQHVVAKSSVNIGTLRRVRVVSTPSLKTETP